MYERGVVMNHSIFSNKNPILLRFLGIEDLTEDESRYLRENWKIFYQDTFELGSEKVEEKWGSLKDCIVADFKDYVKYRKPEKNKLTLPLTTQSKELKEKKLALEILLGRKVDKIELANFIDNFELVCFDMINMNNSKFARKYAYRKFEGADENVLSETSSKQIYLAQPPEKNMDYFE